MWAFVLKYLASAIDIVTQYYMAPVYMWTAIAEFLIIIALVAYIIYINNAHKTT